MGCKFTIKIPLDNRWFPGNAAAVYNYFGGTISFDSLHNLQKASLGLDQVKFAIDGHAQYLALLKDPGG
jgi:hypothetical protein